MTKKLADEVVPNEKEMVLKQLSELKDSDGWKLVCKMLSGLQKECEEDIFSISDGDSEVKYSKLDVLRRERKYLSALSSYPDFLIQSLTEKNDLGVDEFDPYN